MSTATNTDNITATTDTTTNATTGTTTTTTITSTSNDPNNPNEPNLDELEDDNNSLLKTKKKKSQNTWDDREEHILKGWAEKSSCLQLMHDRSHKRYRCLNAWFAIPIIILSTIAGTGNFAQESFGDTYKYYIIYTIASIGILTGILQTISQYLTIGQKLEGHRLASISWDKFARKIKVELSKDRKSRQNVDEFLSNSQETYDRLVEITPSLPNDSIRWFNKLVNEGVNSDDTKGCCLCGYLCCCFPCGIDCCNNCKRKSKKDNQDMIRTRNTMQNIEMPEILGKIQPVIINNDVIVNKKKNRYSIYELDDSINDALSSV
tara:strand:+ start:773 stop:1732 length:960 start_codon:yes stop_codon:yes gene_type:complete